MRSIETSVDHWHQQIPMCYRRFLSRYCLVMAQLHKLAKKFDSVWQTLSQLYGKSETYLVFSSIVHRCCVREGDGESTDEGVEGCTGTNELFSFFVWWFPVSKVDIDNLGAIILSPTVAIVAADLLSLSSLLSINLLLDTRGNGSWTFVSSENEKKLFSQKWKILVKLLIYFNY